MSVILAIGGTDSSGGAGLSRDAAMAERMGCLLKPVVTAVTVQTNDAVLAVHPLPVTVLAAQLEAALEAPRPGAIKIGMLATAEQILCLSERLPADLPVVLDPVLRASSGGGLTPGAALRPLLPKVTLLTPNLPESAALTERKIAASEPELRRQAEALRTLGPAAVLIKGGHGSGPECVDYLFSGEEETHLSAPRQSGERRGTGCSLATTLACALAQGADLPAAAARAKAAVTGWLGENTSI